MKKVLYTINLVLVLQIFTLAQTNVELLSHLNPNQNIEYNDIWGYADSLGNEYALLGASIGTYIVNITDPNNPQVVTLIPGPNSIWRDIKTHGHYAYTVTERGGPGGGLQIIDLSQLPASAQLVKTVSTFFNTAHNLYIADGYAYVVGTDGGGYMHILDLADPINPVEKSVYSGSNYIHDVYVWNDTAYASASDSYDVIDVSNKKNPAKVSESEVLPGIFAHEGWLSEDKRYFVGTDEFNVRDLTVWDLKDRTKWELKVPSWQMPDDAIIHNVIIKGNYAHISYYGDGYVVLDITNPLAPFMIGQYDTNPGTGGFVGAWGVYPLLPSGNTIISDIETGLYVLKFTPGDVPPSIAHTNLTQVLNIDPVTITATIVDNSSIKDAALYYRATVDSVTGNWLTVTDSDGPVNGVYEFQIPGFKHLSTVEYFLAAIDDSSNLSTLPKGGQGSSILNITPPNNTFAYQVIIAGTPILHAFYPASDTTIARNGSVLFSVQVEDTSKLSINYKWIRKNKIQRVTPTYNYVPSPSWPAPRVDSITVVISNGFNSVEHTWAINVLDNITDVNDEVLRFDYTLEQNYPNPFNPSTNIKFSIPNSQFVNLSVYNMLGQKVATLVNEELSGGVHNISFDASNLSSGIYLARIKASNFSKIIKMTLLK